MKAVIRKIAGWPKIHVLALMRAGRPAGLGGSGGLGYIIPGRRRGRSSMVERQLPKLKMGF
jgi:hypothetical protein